MKEKNVMGVDDHSIMFFNECFDVKDVPADGDCLFSAIADFTDYNKKELRSIVCRELEENTNIYQHNIDLEMHGCKTWPDYIKKMAKPGCWGGEIEIKAAANALNRPIVVFQNHGEIFTQYNNNSKLEPIFTLYFNKKKHYGVCNLKRGLSYIRVLKSLSTLNGQKQPNVHVLNNQKTKRKRIEGLNKKFHLPEAHVVKQNQAIKAKQKVKQKTTEQETLQILNIANIIKKKRRGRQVNFMKETLPITKNEKGANTWGYWLFSVYTQAMYLHDIVKEKKKLKEYDKDKYLPKHFLPCINKKRWFYSKVDFKQLYFDRMILNIFYQVSKQQVLTDLAIDKITALIESSGNVVELIFDSGNYNNIINRFVGVSICHKDYEDSKCQYAKSIGDIFYNSVDNLKAWTETEVYYVTHTYYDSATGTYDTCEERREREVRKFSYDLNSPKSKFGVCKIVNEFCYESLVILYYSFLRDKTQISNYPERIKRIENALDNDEQCSKAALKILMLFHDSDKLDHKKLIGHQISNIIKKNGINDALIYLELQAQKKNSPEYFQISDRLSQLTLCATGNNFNVKIKKYIIDILEVYLQHKKSILPKSCVKK